MTGWLLDTFVYTGLLIAAVLLLRRPVSRWFGPQIAYAMWALPFLRFVMPPIVLPAELAPAPSEPLQAALIPLPDHAAPVAVVPLPAVQGGLGLVELTAAVWLGGAALFLAWRVRDYLRMRRILLADARPVGEAGRVRLVESPEVRSPIAFGVIDKVVALPPLFMAQPDRAARDMAIAHELAHHRGHDLIANIAAQPLLALHWFNPVAWLGWRAMRRDQEAACDARVMAGRDRAERASYARVIAGFAAGPNLALAAPMACPVLGEKSIIQRLRNLGMADVPTYRRRMGVAALCTTALALPLTASISYEQARARDLPATPTVALSVPQARHVPQSPAVPAAMGLDEIAFAVPVDGIAMPVLDGRAQVNAEMRAAIGQARQDIDRAEAEALRAEAEARRAQAELERHAREMAFAIDSIPACGGQVIVPDSASVGSRAVTCQKSAMLEALRSLHAARAAISAAPALDPETRRIALDDLLEGIGDLEEGLREISLVSPVGARAAMLVGNGTRIRITHRVQAIDRPAAAPAVRAVLVTRTVPVVVRKPAPPSPPAIRVRSVEAGAVSAVTA